jgi:hypothetical protein
MVGEVLLRVSHPILIITMKNWLTQGLGFCALAMLSLSSCKKDEVKATLSPSNIPTLTTTTTSPVVLTQANANQTAATFTWTPVSSFDWTGVDHPYTPSTTYYLQIAKQGSNFAAPVSIAAGNGPTTAVTVGDLNTSLTTLGLTPGTATPLEVRLNASYAGNSSTYSAAVPLTVTPYKACVPPAGSSTWSVIGDAAVDWNTDVPMTYNCDTKTFDVTRTFKAGAFKFRANNAWVLDYGSNSSTGGALAAGGSNITVTTPGTYTIKLDLNNMVYSIK